MSTIMQRKAIDNIVRKDMNISTAMRQAGYAQPLQTNQLTKSRAYQEAIDKWLKEDKLLKLVEQGTRARSNKSPDWNNRHKFIETALRLKGFNSEQGTTGATINIINPLTVEMSANVAKEEQG